RSAKTNAERVAQMDLWPQRRAMLVLRRKARLCENTLMAAIISRSSGWRWGSARRSRPTARPLLCRLFRSGSLGAFGEPPAFFGTQVAFADVFAQVLQDGFNDTAN